MDKWMKNYNWPEAGFMIAMCVHTHILSRIHLLYSRWSQTDIFNNAGLVVAIPTTQNSVQNLWMYSHIAIKLTTSSRSRVDFNITW